MKINQTPVGNIYSRYKGIFIMLLIIILFTGCKALENNPSVIPSINQDSNQVVEGSMPPITPADNQVPPTTSVTTTPTTSVTTFPTTTATTFPATSESTFPSTSPYESSVTISPEPTQEITPTKQRSQVTLLAVGDNLIHREVVLSGKQSDGSYQFDHLYSNLMDEISAADIAIVNQETILGGSDFAYTGYPNFNSPTEIGDALIGAGFDVVLQATNHTMDMGQKGVMNTLDYWETHPEITVLGIHRTKKDREKVTVIEKNGIKIAMLNYTYGLNGYKVPEDKPYLVNLINKKQMTLDIDKAKKEADFVIVFPHWGSEYVYKATAEQEALTTFFYEQGVDLVIGSHPHVLEPVEWIKTNEDHSMLVYYSLGNFMSYQKEAPRMLGGMATLTITKDFTGTYISKAGITPIVTHYENGPADFHYAIYKLNDYSKELADIHGVKDIARKGPLNYDTITSLAKDILGSWYDFQSNNP